MFSSLKVKNFRLYWIGMFVSLIGSWIQTTAQSWLVFELTHSAFLLGMVGFLASLPVFVLSLFAGVFADRFNKRVILICTQAAFMLLAFLLAALTQFKVITTSQIMVIALLNGVVMAFDAPSRQAMVVELVGRQYLLNAVALNSVSFNSSRIMGPALAGILVASIGMSSCFYVNGISFLAVIIPLLYIRNNIASRSATKNSVIGDLWEGLRFIRESRAILVLIALVGIISLFGLPYLVLMPIFAEDVLGVGLKGFGMLMSASGVGALAAALMLARLGDSKYKGRILISCAFIFSLSLIAFSFIKAYALSLLALVLLGWSSVAALALMNTLLQQLSPDAVRGRVMSAFMFTFAGVMPFGNLISGSLAHYLGVSAAIFIGGAICNISVICIGALYPEIARLR